MKTNCLKCLHKICKRNIFAFINKKFYLNLRNYGS
uniref:Uncharacterized protein n=1 Tax=virus sp. ctuWX8 TaxID=2826816 RepID=A0A8S5R721_9VIRU|nr:MAG TPA: hypothetical protein [virus sp. ctuWX8]